MPTFYSQSTGRNTIFIIAQNLCCIAVEIYFRTGCGIEKNENKYGNAYLLKHLQTCHPSFKGDKIRASSQLRNRSKDNGTCATRIER